MDRANGNGLNGNGLNRKSDQDTICIDENDPDYFEIVMLRNKHRREAPRHDLKEAEAEFDAAVKQVQEGSKRLQKGVKRIKTTFGLQSNSGNGPA